jgi:hypothetical protein
MKAQFFIISAVIMMYVIVLTFQYLAGFSDIRLTQVEEQQELSYIQDIKDSFIQTFNISNSSNGDLNKIIKDMEYTESFFKQELLKKGIGFDSKFLFFSNDFESCDLSKWTSNYSNPELTKEVKYHGTYSLYCNNVKYVYKKIPGVNEVYTRIYVNFNKMPLNPYRHYFIDFYDSGIQILGLGLWNDNNDYKLRAYSTSIGSWNSSIDIHENEWHYFELYWYENGTNSKIKAWYDGNLKIEQTVNSGGNGKSIDEYRFGAVTTGGGATTPDLYTDCVAISSDYIGDECYPDEEPYFVFNLKSSELYTKTEFPYSEFSCDGVLCLKFDECSGNIAHDSSSYHNDGILKNYTGSCGGTACPSWTNGKFGKALDFDGIGDYVEISENPSLNITNEMTVSAWVYPMPIQSSGGSNQIIQRLNWGSPGSSRNGFFLREGSSGNHEPNFYVANGTDWTSVNAGSISSNNWHYITGTVKSNDKIRIYVDGNLKNEDNFIGNISQYTGGIKIGYERSELTFNGTIDEVRIWDRVLTQPEIQTEMNKG